MQQKWTLWIRIMCIVYVLKSNSHEISEITASTATKPNRLGVVVGQKWIKLTKKKSKQKTVQYAAIFILFFLFLRWFCSVFFFFLLFFIMILCLHCKLLDLFQVHGPFIHYMYLYVIFAIVWWKYMHFNSFWLFLFLGLNYLNIYLQKL